MNDPYVYKGTSVLINKLNIKDEKALDQAETAYAIFAIDELKKYSGQGNKSDEARAAELAQENPLNDQYELVLSCVKEYSGQSKKELCNKIYNWIIAM